MSHIARRSWRAAIRSRLAAAARSRRRRPSASGRRACEVTERSGGVILRLAPAARLRMRAEVDRAVIVTLWKNHLILSCGRKAAVEGSGPGFRLISIGLHYCRQSRSSRLGASDLLWNGAASEGEVY